jgi:hypothetical protein
MDAISNTRLIVRYDGRPLREVVAGVSVTGRMVDQTIVGYFDRFDTPRAPEQVHVCFLAGGEIPADERTAKCLDRFAQRMRYRRLSFSSALAVAEQFKVDHLRRPCIVLYTSPLYFPRPGRPERTRGHLLVIDRKYGHNVLTSIRTQHERERPLPSRFLFAFQVPG